MILTGETRTEKMHPPPFKSLKAVYSWILCVPASFFVLSRAALFSLLPCPVLVDSLVLRMPCHETFAVLFSPRRL
jgi:hypothetical protein